MTLLPPPPPPRPEVTESYAGAWRHFDARLRERHGLTIGLIEYTRLCLEIGEQDLLLSGIALSTVTRRDVLLRVRIQGVTVPCVWRVDPGILVTAYAHAMTFRSSPSEVRAHIKEKARKMRRKLTRYKRHAKHKKESV